MSILLRIKMTLPALMLALFVSLPALAATETPAVLPEQQITNLDELLQSVREDQRREKALNRKREQQFLRDKTRQKSLLTRARRDFELLQKNNNPLKKITEANSAEIKSLQKKLDQKKRDMGDIYSIYSEMAGDFSAALQSSMITAQIPQRSKQLTLLAKTKQLATIHELEELWLLIQEEMTESGKVTRFDAPVVTISGMIENKPVLRVGPFTALSDGEFLRFIPETGELLALDRQPPSRYRREAKQFSTSSGELLPMVIDPTGGSLLSMMTYTPTLRERIDTGGTIGYIIIGLGILGLIIVLWRAIYLGSGYLSIRQQLASSDQPSSDNPLGRVLLSAKQFADDPTTVDGEAIQYKLDEAVLAEIPALERSHGLLKLMAVTSPLLGLLGTVTGMILTFQAISLFGGDPKLMAGGISQALTTTVLGLVVAIPLLFGHSLVSALASGIIQHLDEQSAGIMARLIEHQRPPSKTGKK